MYKNQKGFSVVEVFIVLIIMGAVGVIGWKILSGNKDSSKNNTQNNVQQDAQKEELSNNEGGLIWQQTDGGWRAAQTAPACPEQPILRMPADISKVTAILYPGQTRGGNYKPHGGFRFDNSDNNIK